LAVIAAFRPFKHRNFTLLWSANLVSNIGTWMETIAVGAILARDTKKAAALGLAAAASFVPMALLAPVGGLISDRVHRKKFLLGTLAFDLFLAVVLAALIATGHRSPALLSAVLFLEGCSAALSLPNRQAIMPDLVPKEDLLAAVALGSASWNGGRIVGPLLAGLLISATSPAWAVSANAASFAFMLIAAFFIQLPQPKRAEMADSVKSRIAEGLNAVRSVPDNRLALILIAILAATAGPFIGLIPIVAQNVFGGGAKTISLFVTAQGAGAVIGVLTAASIAERIGRKPAIAGAFAIISAALVIYGRAPTTAIAAGALVVIGACYFTVLTGCQGLLQRNTPSEKRARVLAIFSVALGGPYAATMTIAGFSADRIGLRFITTVQGVLTLVAISALSVLRRDWWVDAPIPETGLSHLPEPSGSIKPAE
jgi:MFS family permease